MRRTKVRPEFLVARPGTSDEFTINEVWSREVYTKKIPVEPGDVWFDIGANIGTFAALVTHRGGRVVAFEPEEDNFALLNKNAPGSPIIRAAVIGGVDSEIRFYKTSNVDGHTIIAGRTRKEIRVPAVNINDMLRKYKPNKLKLDCEGSEVDIITAMDWSIFPIVGLAMEFHHSKLRDKSQVLYRSVIEILQANFVEVQFKESPGGNWHTMVYATG